MKKLNDYVTMTDKEAQTYLANLFPSGKLFGNKHDPDTNIYKYILCLSTFVKIVSGQVYDFLRNLDANQIDSLMTEYEESLKLSERFARRSTIEDRRTAVKRLKSKIPVYNVDDGLVNIQTTIENFVSAVTGIVIEAEGQYSTVSTSAFTIDFPVQFGSPATTRRFTLTVRVDTGGDLANNIFPLPFPVRFFDDDITETLRAILDNVLDEVVPAFMAWEYTIL
jgi:hypothetical protein